MDEAVRFHFVVDGEDFTSAGQASVQVKKNLRKLGIPPETIRKMKNAVAVASGVGKAQAVQAVLRSGMMDTLIIDSALAAAVIRDMEELQ